MKVVKRISLMMIMTGVKMKLKYLQVCSVVTEYGHAL